MQGSKTAKLWYNKPATKFTEALPIGNGSIGGMVYGGGRRERISLNQDEIWSGYPEDKTNPEALTSVARARALLQNGKVADAEIELWRNALSTWTCAYQPAGNLVIDLSHSDTMESYYRDLDLATAVATTTYAVDGVRYTREAFCSFPDKVMVIQLLCDRKGELNATIALDSPHTFQTAKVGTRLCLQGLAPLYAAPSYYTCDHPVVYGDFANNDALTFSVGVKPYIRGGDMWVTEDRITIENADEIQIYVTIATNFEGYGTHPRDSQKDSHHLCNTVLDTIDPGAYAAIKARHIADHQDLFSRVELHIGGHDCCDTPTDQRIAKFSQQPADLGLIALLFDYGRYLTIASSRVGTQAANLQGIWNEDVRPPWSSNYTININAQMNYWHVESCNLSECHHPFLSFIHELSQKGRKTAEVHYGCRGWCAHHNSDLWRQSEPVGKLSPDQGLVGCGFWNVSGAWLARHIWEHYTFTQDRSFLRENWQTLKGAALFIIDLLIEDEHGFLYTSPSTSPENRYLLDGQSYAICQGSTMDLAIARDVLDICLRAGKLLQVDGDIRPEIEAAYKNLRPYKIGSRGQLLEWDKDYQELDPHHRHISHLYGLYPGHSIHPDTQELFDAVVRSMELRGDDSTGWSLGWKTNIWARALNGDRAAKLIHMLLRPVTDSDVAYSGGGGVYPNLFDAHPPFQIDGNFGVTAGIAEMLLQSHLGEIWILPALPERWPSGRVKGLRARGGYTIDITWDEGALSEITVKAHVSNTCRLKYGKSIVTIDVEQGRVYRLDRHLHQLHR